MKHLKLFEEIDWDQWDEEEFDESYKDKFPDNLMYLYDFLEEHNATKEFLDLYSEKLLRNKHFVKIESLVEKDRNKVNGLLLAIFIEIFMDHNHNDDKRKWANILYDWCDYVGLDKFKKNLDIITRGYVEHNESNNITFEILDYDYESITEAINYYDKSVKGKGNINIPLSNSQYNRLKGIKKDIDLRLKEINDFEGQYINEQGHIIKRKYEIRYDEHWIRKFMRKEIEDPTGELGIKEPGKFEGIDLVYNNVDELTKRLFQNRIDIKNRVLIKAKNREGYELIIQIEKEILQKKKYRIYFITQMKGIGHNYKFYNPSNKPIRTIMKLDPNGQKNNPSFSG